MSADASSLDCALPASRPALAVAGGTLHFSGPRQVAESLEPGWKLVLVIDGAMRYCLPGGAPRSVNGPSLHQSLCREPLLLEHEFGLSGALRFVSLRSSFEELAPSCGLDPDQLAHRLGAAAGPYAEQNRRAEPAMLAVGRQMLECPVPESLRSLYLSGKAMELAALALAGTTEAPAGAGLSRVDRDRLQQARERLLADLQCPPTLPELAQAVGINVNKLTLGFRRLFGQSVYGYVREQRLQRAHALLAAGVMSVSEAAYACGYTDSHFTKAFRRRYGITPSELRR
ncbi:helix-turn-helix transcriptional regulator [Bordetella trematum]|uniref:helix-turn-helix transcriptional regulator n=1 Tax=Bordetella trematum TaxID=123899 RepID=UPI002093297B|nr:AraC family transcriptional regulator [Bordetella trematum]